MKAETAVVIIDSIVIITVGFLLYHGIFAGLILLIGLVNTSTKKGQE